MSLIDEILSRPEFRDQPPVLVDIGASEYIHALWRRIARHSVCIAFDADERELNVEDKRSRAFRKLHVVRALVVPQAARSVKFHLTSSPYCSSVLEPAKEELAVWSFADKFKVEQTLAVRATTLKSALQEAGVRYIDWFKSDSQGLDLRLFASLSKPVREHVSVAEFEPGFIDAYRREDKLHDLLRYMDSQPFWLASATIKGPRRISRGALNSVAPSSIGRKLIEFSVKPSPGWAEMVYLRCANERTPVRQQLFLWVAATILRQHGFAYELATQAQEDSNDPDFTRMKLASRRALYGSIFSGRLAGAVAEKISKLLKIA